MIGRLYGRVIAQEAGGIVVLDVGGVGYELFIPTGTVGRISADGEGKVLFFVYTYVREEALILFGFATEMDRFAFRTLIGISSIGPKTALAILSALPCSELALAIEQNDLLLLTQVPGIGKKTAQRLALELRDKLSSLGGPSERISSKTEPTVKETVTQALINMGYRSAEAERAVTNLSKQFTTLSVPELVREALAVLSK